MHSFKIEKYERQIEQNTSLLSSYDTKNTFKEFKSRLEILNSEFLNHKTQEEETVKDLSPIILKDNSIMNSSSNLTEMPSYLEDITRVVTSNSNLTRLSDIQEHDLNLGNKIFMSQICSRKNKMRTSYSQLEEQVTYYENNMGSFLKIEAQLKGEIVRLEMERDSFKKLLKDDEYFIDLQTSISNISTAILTHKSIGELKFNHQMMLKSLIDDEMRRRLKENNTIKE